MFEKIFRLSEHGTTVRTEFLAGLTTFATMAYILAVNPQILAQCGMDAPAVFVATALSAAIATCIMGLCANLPIALAPGMGLNAFFAFSVVLGMGYSWQFALTAVFLEGIIFILLTVTNVRKVILHCIPDALRKAICAGIGLFIAFIGLNSAGIVVPHQATLLTMGDMASAGAVVTVVGIGLSSVLLCLKVRGALLLGIVGASLVGIPLGVTNLASFDASLLFTIPSIEPTFMQFDWGQVFTLDMLLVVTTFLFVDLFDTLGTLLGLATKVGILDKDGNLPRAKEAFLADALGTTVGAVLGTSTVSAYVESASGVAEGGKTGLTAVVVALLFLLALFLAPVFLLIPSQATAAALILVGLFMLMPLVEVDFNDFSQSIPVFFTLIMMPLTYSIATGIMWGIIAHVFLHVCIGRARELSFISYVLCCVFLIKLTVG